MHLITRADLDGVLCAAMIADMEKLTDISFAHPKDVEDDLIDIPKGCIIANLPYHSNASYWFEQVSKTSKTHVLPEGVKGLTEKAPSAARLVYKYYNNHELKKYEHILGDADRLNSADLNFQDILKPEGWILIGFTLDPRTGLGDFREYAMIVINAIREEKSLKEILEMPAVRGRIKKYLHEENEFKKVLIANTEVFNNVSITDFRNVDEVPTGNRFMVFPLFARCNVNMRIYPHREATKVMVAVGKSIFDRSLKINIGKLMEEYGGGGLEGAGTCPLPAQNADKLIAEIRLKLKQDK